MSDDLNKENEIVTVELPRWQVEIIKQLVKERNTMNNVTHFIKSWWIWVVAGGILTLWTLWDKIFKVAG